MLNKAWLFVAERAHIILVILALVIIYIWTDHARIEKVTKTVTLSTQKSALQANQKELLEAAKKDAIIMSTKTEIIADNHADKVEVIESRQRKTDEIRARAKNVPDEILAEAQINGLWATWCQTAVYNDDEKGCQP